MKILIVDDEHLARERLLRLLASACSGATCFQASNGEEALAAVEGDAPELVLLDINMPGMSGIEVAARLAVLEKPPAVIFCTAYDEYALQAFEQHAVAYLLKPVREVKLAAAIENASRVSRLQLASLETEGGGRSRVSGHTHRGLETLLVADVRCFLAEHKYVTAYSPEGDLLIPDTLRELEDEFSRNFVRVHRSALVSLGHIAGLHRSYGGSWAVELTGLELRPAVSRRHLAELKQRLQQV